MRPLLILFIHLGLGGVQRKIVDIVNYLTDYKPDLPIYILLRTKESFDLSPEIKNKNVRIINYQDWAKIKIPLFFPIFVIHQIWRLKPKAVLAFLDFVSLPAIWARIILFWRKFKLVLSEDHYTSEIIPLFTFGRLRNFLVKVFYPFADTVFTCSEVTKRDLIQNYALPEGKIKIIRNWTTFMERDVKTRTEKYDFIYIGRMFKTKNLEFLIRALKKIKTKKRNIKLCLLGGGQEKKRLQEMVKKDGLEENVDFVKPQHNVEDFLACSKLFVYSSQFRAEGFPMTVLEAMAIGTPVLTRNFAGAGEFLKDGENCYLFETETEFIKKAVWLLDNPKERRLIALEAKKYVQENHSKENIKVYLKALEI